MPGRDLDILISAAHQAGDIAKRFFKANPQVWDKADGAGPVTQADLAVNDAWAASLQSARPDYGWLSEESDNNATRLGCEHVFILDPIDGTRAFIDGSKDWAHSLAVARQGVVIAAVVYLPMVDMLFTAERGRGAQLNGTAINVSPQSTPDGATILATKNNFNSQHWPGGLPHGLKRTFRSSLAYRLCLVGQGKFDGMITLRPTWEWDIAAGQLIVEQAGGTVTTQRGQSPLYNNPTPRIDGVVAAPGALHHGLIQGLYPRQQKD